jgi:hypothetical protein
MFLFNKARRQQMLIYQAWPKKTKEPLSHTDILAMKYLTIFKTILWLFAKG